MTATAMIAELAQAGIRLSRHGDRLHVEAKPGTVTPAIRERLAANKPDLLAWIESLDAIRTRLLALATSEGLPASLVHVRADVFDEYADADDNVLRACLRAWARERPASCARCGPVLLPPHWPASVTACPWCFRHKAGKAIPRPTTTRE